jgi:hypothetical protein
MRLALNQVMVHLRYDYFAYMHAKCSLSSHEKDNDYSSPPLVDALVDALVEMMN